MQINVRNCVTRRKIFNKLLIANRQQKKETYNYYKEPFIFIFRILVALLLPVSFFLVERHVLRYMANIRVRCY